MDKQKVIESLNTFKERLAGEVFQAFHTRGRDFGRERFSTWRRKFSQFLDDNLPGETSVLNAKLMHFAFSVRHGESAAETFWREDGETMLAYIDSLIIDVENDEYDFRKVDKDEEPAAQVGQNQKPKNKVCTGTMVKQRSALRAF